VLKQDVRDEKIPLRSKRDSHDRNFQQGEKLDNAGFKNHHQEPCNDKGIIKSALHYSRLVVILVGRLCPGFNPGATSGAIPERALSRGGG